MGAQLVPLQEKLHFGESFELNPRNGELRRSGRVLKLERIPTEILLLLIERSGEIVTREEIVERIWGAGAVLDTDNSINGAIRKIRRILKDDPEHPQFVQTVTGKGYRFVASISSPVIETSTFSPPQLEPPIPVPPPRRQLWWPIVVGFVVALIAIPLAIRHWSHPQVVPAVAGGKLMLAVLPFENLTGDAGQDYFSDGLTEEMITQLERVDPERLGVIARTSVLRYKTLRQPVAQIGGELGVQYVLEGSVRRDNNHVLVTAQLIQVRDQTHLLTREYDRELKDLLVLQDELAQEIADEIQLALRDHKAPSPTRQPALTQKSYEAYDLYLRGRFFWNKRSRDGFQRAIKCFQEAITKDPKYARAYAGLADSYAMMSGYGLVPAGEYMPKARAAAMEALELDDSLTEAHTSLAVIAQNYDWDWQTAEKEYRRAIQLDPNYATAHQWYAESLAFQGRFDEALAESERARQLDPLSLIIAADNGAILYFSRQYDRAIERFRSVLDMDPAVGRAHLVIGAFVEKGQFKEAAADLDNWRNSGDGPWTWAWEAYTYGRAGETIRAQHALQKLTHTNRTSDLDSSALLAFAYAGMGDKDKSIASLQQAYSRHSNALASLKVDPAYDLLRGDPRFQELLHHIGLGQ